MKRYLVYFLIWLACTSACTLWGLLIFSSGELGGQLIQFVIRIHVMSFAMLVVTRIIVEWRAKNRLDKDNSMPQI